MLEVVHRPCRWRESLAPSVVLCRHAVLYVYVVVLAFVRVVVGRLCRCRDRCRLSRVCHPGVVVLVNAVRVVRVVRVVLGVVVVFVLN